MSVKINHKLTWSMGGPWYWEFQQLEEPHGSIWSQIAFLTKYGFKTMGMNFKELDKMTDEDKEKLLSLLKENELTFHPTAHLDFFKASTDEIKHFIEEWLTNLNKYKSFFDSKITTSGLHAGHRFDRVMPLEKKFEILSNNIGPIAKALAEAGYPLCVENHGDYYCSDIVELCKITPDLYIFLDTGNPYLIGERVLEAFETAAPYTIGTHFKDHYVQPNPSTLHFELDGAPLGDGDCMLRECYKILMEKAPNPDSLIMEIEMVAPKGMDPLECMEQSIKFINSL